MYRIYDSEKFIYVKNWLEKDHEAVNVFKNLKIKDLFEKSMCTLGLDYCPKYWDYDFSGKRFLVYGLSKSDMNAIIKELINHDIDCMITNNLQHVLTKQELLDKVAYKEFKKKKYRKENKNE